MSHHAASLLRAQFKSAHDVLERTMLANFALANIQWHTGEIACLKGLQGKKGYPF
jgi:hypothetical protein